VFVLSKPFLSDVKFDIKAGEPILEWGTQISSILTHWKGMLGTNAAAYSAKEKRSLVGLSSLVNYLKVRPGAYPCEGALR
jgi:hypothetical protein